MDCFLAMFLLYIKSVITHGCHQDRHALSPFLKAQVLRSWQTYNSVCSNDVQLTHCDSFHRSSTFALAVVKSTYTVYFFEHRYCSNNSNQSPCVALCSNHTNCKACTSDASVSVFPTQATQLLFEPQTLFERGFYTDNCGTC